MHQSGLCSIAFRHLSVEEIIATAKDAGLSCIEWGSDVHAPKDDLENIDRVRKLTEAAGLRCCSYGTYFRIDRDSVEDIHSYIAAAKCLGVDVVRIWCPGNPATISEEEKQRRYGICRELAKIAEAEGVTLCAECHSANLTDNSQSSLEFMQAVNSPAFRMYWQPHESFSAEDNLAFAEAVAPYVVNVHVFYWKEHTRLPLKDAWDAWKSYIGALGSDRIFLLEHIPDDDKTLLFREADTLRSLLK